MPRFNYESIIRAPANLVFDWHHDPAAIEKLTPPWEPVKVVGTPASIDETGSRTTLELSMLGVMRLHWVAEHRNHNKNVHFWCYSLSLGGGTPKLPTRQVFSGCTN